MAILLYNIVTKVNKIKTMKTFRKQPKKKSYFVPILIIAGVVIVALAILWFLGSLRDSPKTSDSTKQASSTASGTSTTTKDPSSTTTTVDSSDGNTATNTKANATTSNSTGSTTSVTITSVDQTQADVINISAYASAVVSTGTCQFTFTNGSVSFYKDTSTSPSASTSSCATLSLNNSDFPSLGTWQLVVSFSSGTITGSSTQTPVVVK
jgi:cytoskeletal protein RodZ